MEGRVKGRALAVIAAALLTGCGPVAYAGAVGYDTGSVASRWIGTGIGGQAEAILYPGGGRFGLGPSAQVGGYASTGGSAIGFSTVELRYHAPNRIRTLPYYQLGTGGGVAWTPRVRHLVLPLQLEIGLERELGSATGRVGVRERFLGLVGTQGGETAVFNSLQLIFGVTTGGGF
jgi:hypothetical protein